MRRQSSPALFREEDDEPKNDCGVGKVDNTAHIDLRTRMYSGAKGRLVGGDVKSLKELFALDESERPFATLNWQLNKVNHVPDVLKKWIHPFELAPGTETKILCFLDQEEVKEPDDLRTMFDSNIRDLLSLVPPHQRSRVKEGINKVRKVDYGQDIDPEPITPSTPPPPRRKYLNRSKTLELEPAMSKEKTDNKLLSKTSPSKSPERNKTFNRSKSLNTDKEISTDGSKPPLQRSKTLELDKEANIAPTFPSSRPKTADAVRSSARALLQRSKSLTATPTSSNRIGPLSSTSSSQLAPLLKKESPKEAHPILLLRSNTMVPTVIPDSDDSDSSSFSSERPDRQKHHLQHDIEHQSHIMSDIDIADKKVNNSSLDEEEDIDTGDKINQPSSPQEQELLPPKVSRRKSSGDHLSRALGRLHWSSQHHTPILLASPAMRRRSMADIAGGTSGGSGGLSGLSGGGKDHLSTALVSLIRPSSTAEERSSNRDHLGAAMQNLKIPVNSYELKRRSLPDMTSQMSLTTESRHRSISDATESDTQQQQSTTPILPFNHTELKNTSPDIPKKPTVLETREENNPEEQEREKVLKMIENLQQKVSSLEAAAASATSKLQRRRSINDIASNHLSLAVAKLNRSNSIVGKQDLMIPEVEETKKKVTFERDHKSMNENTSGGDHLSSAVLKLNRSNSIVGREPLITPEIEENMRRKSMNDLNKGEDDDNHLSSAMLKLNRSNSIVGGEPLITPEIEESIRRKSMIDLNNGSISDIHLSSALSKLNKSSSVSIVPDHLSTAVLKLNRSNSITGSKSALIIPEVDDKFRRKSMNDINHRSDDHLSSALGTLHRSRNEALNPHLSSAVMKLNRSNSIVGKKPLTPEIEARIRRKSMSDIADDDHHHISSAMLKLIRSKSEYQQTTSKQLIPTKEEPQLKLEAESDHLFSAIVKLHKSKSTVPSYHEDRLSTLVPELPPTASQVTFSLPEHEKPLEPIKDESFEDNTTNREEETSLLQASDINPKNDKEDNVKENKKEKRGSKSSQSEAKQSTTDPNVLKELIRQSDELHEAIHGNNDEEDDIHSDDVDHDVIDNSRSREFQGRALYREGARRYQAVKAAAKLRKLPWQEFLEQNPVYKKEMDYIVASWEEACELGSGGKSERALGVLYQLGRHVEKDIFRARELYERAEVGSSARARASAKNALGAMQERGIAGFGCSIKEAKKRYEEAGDLSAHALFNLGNIHRNRAMQQAGMEALCTFGTEHLSKKARKGLQNATHAYHKAIHLHRHGNSAFNLAVMHQSGMLHGKELHPEVMVTKLLKDDDNDELPKRTDTADLDSNPSSDSDSDSDSSSSSDIEAEDYHDKKHNEEARRLYKLAAISGGEKVVEKSKQFSKKMKCATAPLVGKRVYLKDIRKAKHQKLNGRLGIAFYFDKDTFRYTVKLDGGSFLRMRPENIEEIYDETDHVEVT